MTPKIPGVVDDEIVRLAEEIGWSGAGSAASLAERVEAALRWAFGAGWDARVVMCQAAEWKRDERGRWSRRSCLFVAGHGVRGLEDHTFGPWREAVEPGAASAAEIFAAARPMTSAVSAWIDKTYAKDVER